MMWDDPVSLVCDTAAVVSPVSGCQPATNVNPGDSVMSSHALFIFTCHKDEDLIWMMILHTVVAVTLANIKEIIY